MPLNLPKTYPQLLELMHYNEYDRKSSLRRIFNRDVQENNAFYFLKKVIRPIKIDGLINLDRVFNHLVTEDEEVIRDDGSKYTKRVFEKDRAHRLHWLKLHVEMAIKDEVVVFSVVERDKTKRKDITRTYIYNITQKYVVVLEPQNSEKDYYLLSAYHLNKKYAIKQMGKKYKKKLPVVY